VVFLQSDCGIVNELSYITLGTKSRFLQFHDLIFKVFSTIIIGVQILAHKLMSRSRLVKVLI